MELINENIVITSDDLCIEPSAGNGSFIDSIKLLFTSYKFYDIEPENDEIIKQDYLEYNYDDNDKEKYNKIHLIGNPPFGRQSSLAIKFIKKSCHFCDTFSFILPKSFKKDSLKKKIPLNFHLICQYDMPNNSFLVNNNEHDVPSVFQIWEKRNYDRIVNEKLYPINFIFVKKTENPDISFRRIGFYAGAIDTHTDEKSIQSHYFIKINDNGKSISENIFALNTIRYDTDNTTGPKSISKQELIFKFNQLLHRDYK
jgi:hypothetical protein